MSDAKKPQHLTHATGTPVTDNLNILTAGHLSPEIRADIFISVIRELAGESSVGPRSDLFLRAALQAVMIVEPVPALQHVSALLDPYDAGYREWESILPDGIEPFSHWWA